MATTSRLGMDISVKATGAKQVEKLALALEHLQGVSLRGLTSKINSLERMMTPFKDLSAAKGINKFSNSLNKLAATNLTNLGPNIQNIAKALKPLTNEMNRGATAAQAYAAVIQKLSTKAVLSGDAFKKASSKFNIFNGSWQRIIATSYIALRAKDMMAGWVQESNAYIENLNLFSVAMGQYTKQAKAYAEQVGDKLGIDPSQWMRQQGIIMDMSRSFGVSTDTAYAMSKALTQVAYDFSSLYNLNIDEALKKVQSGLAGEIEPLRRIGKDLSVARLQMEATKLGIQENVSQMTQANKAMLRTIALLKQSGSAAGDLARTINSPANQLRIFNAQIVQFKRALGYILLPTLQMILPYLIAFTKVLRLLSEMIAGLFNFRMPTFNYDSLAGNLAMGADSSSDLADNMASAAKSAAKMNSYRAGFDELNVIDTSTGGTGGGGTGGVAGGGSSAVLEAELKKMTEWYDQQFLANVDSKVNNIVGNMLEWLGIGKLITDETGQTSIYMNDISTWSQFFETRLGKILITVGLISTALAGWKIAEGIFTFINSPFTKALLGGAAVEGAAGTGLIGFFTGLPAMLGGLAPIAPLLLVIVGAIIAVIAAVAQLWKENDDFRQQFQLMWQSIKDTLVGVWENFIAPILYVLMTLFEQIWTNVLAPLWDNFKNMIASIGDLVVALWTLIKPFIDVFVKNLGIIFTALMQIVSPAVFSIFQGFGNALSTVFAIISVAVQVLVGGIKTVTAVLRALFTNNWKGLGDTLAGIWGDIWKKIKKTFHDFIQSLVSGFAGFVNVALVGGFNLLIKGFNKLPGIEIPMIPNWNPVIPAFATGGFPEDGLFMANSNELVGQFSNGRTAVANNEQITTGIASGVYEAVYRAMTDASAKGKGETIVVNVEGETLFNINRKVGAKKGQQILQPEYAR